MSTSTLLSGTNLGGATTRRPALGERFTVGGLYNAYEDKFLARNLFGFGDTVQPSFLTISDVPSNQNVQWSVTETDGIQEKAGRLGFSSELTASYLSGMIEPIGSASFLARTSPSFDSQQASLICTIVTRNEKLKMGNQDIENLVSILPEETVDTTHATHVVCGVQHGLLTVITARTKAPGTSRAQDIRTVLATFNPPIDDNSTAFSPSDEVLRLAATLEFDIISDLSGLTVRAIDLEAAYTVARSLPEKLTKINKGRGYRIGYELKPLAEVASALDMKVELDAFTPVSNVHLDQIAKLFDNFVATELQLNDYKVKIASHRTCVPEKEISRTAQQIRDYEKFVNTQKYELSRGLKGVRSGSLSSTDFGKQLANTGSELSFRFDMNSLKSAVKQYTGKMAFFDFLKPEEQRYKADNYDGLSIDIAETIATENGDRKVYIVYYNAQSVFSSLWPDTRDKISELIQANGTIHIVTFVDCDMGGKRLLIAPRIELRQNTEVLVYDLVRDIRDLADRALLHCASSKSIEKVTARIPPVELKPVKISCPGSQCNSNSVLEWICPDCKDTVCFKDSDTYMYCSCGKYDHAKAEFKCKNTSHGLDYIKVADNNKLLTALRALKPYEEYNILILGETGIGKSTFINMFMNFLLFDSLDEACAYPGPVKCVVPGSFKAAVKNKDGYKEEVLDVKFGTEDSNESESSKGQSATQASSAYSFVVNGKVIRLIDTPGIGDTRGLNKDYENVDNVMKLLQSVDKLSAILFLLQPNNSRLTPTFDFCLSELLTHLHRNSTKNLVFGFPRSSGTHFKLGDTRVPLLELLKSRATGITEVDERNTYFFDGDCFRYLAIHKQYHVEMPDKEACKATWQASSDNLRRLMRRTIELPTHAVAETLSLNRTRTIVLNMTDPMIRISAGIADNAKAAKDQVAKIKAAKDKGDSLKGLLEVKKFEVIKTPLNDPRTVCASSACQESVLDEISGVSVIVYKSICHDACAISCIDGAINVAELRECAAFTNLVCTTKSCGHDWSAHMHIRFSVTTQTRVIRYADKEKELSDAQNEERNAENLQRDAEIDMKKYANEQKIIDEALALFGVYLAHHSTVTYNDATIEYLKNLSALATKDGDFDKARELEKRKTAYDEQCKKIKLAIDKKDQSVPNDIALNSKLDQLANLEKVGKQFRQIIGPVTLVALPDTFTVRVRTQPTGTFNHVWFKAPDRPQVIIR